METPVIIYEDNHVIVALKPQNMPSCEDESKDLDLLTYLKNMIKERDNKPGNVYLGLVHRLDRPTGGLWCLQKLLRLRLDYPSKCRKVISKKPTLQP